MNALTCAIAAMCGLSVLAFAGYRRCRLATGDAVSGWAISGLGAALTACALSAYLALGRSADWQTRIEAPRPDPESAARLAQLREAADRQPGSLSVRRELAQAYMDAERYREAAAVLDECLAAGGPRAALLGMKAYALYYRDRGQMRDETRRVVSEALALDPLEVQSRMLLGEDAFRLGKYADAMGHWKALLQAGVAPEKERALKNAITNAQRRMSQGLNK